MTAKQSLRYVFLLGRPGCGKSAVFRALTPRFKAAGLAADFERLDDFPRLWARIMEDDARAREGKERLHSVADEEGRPCLVYPGVFDEILVELSREVEERARDGKIIFIEFARSSYVQALNSFSARVLDAAVIVYIECPFEVCWERNVRRAEAAAQKGTDDHLVPREEMERTYRHDDQSELERHYRGLVVIVDNEREGEEFLGHQAEKVLELVRART